jgi:hypothetical protein
MEQQTNALDIAVGVDYFIRPEHDETLSFGTSFQVPYICEYATDNSKRRRTAQSSKETAKRKLSGLLHVNRLRID